MMTRKRRFSALLAVAMVAIASLLATACGGDDDDDDATPGTTPTTTASAPAMTQELTVGAIHVGSIQDNGYNQAMHEGLMEMVENLKQEGIEVDLKESENVPETADAERVMQQMINAGATLMFPMSFGYLDSALNLAEEHPDVTFEHPAGNKLAENLGTFWSDTTAMEYLMGIAAAKESESGKLGWIIALPIPNILTSINAFTLGAQSVNPDATVQVVVTNSWVDPAKEAEAVNSLADTGVDVVTMLVDSPGTVVQTADKRGIKSIGFHCLCVQSVAGEGWITGIGFTWGDLFTEIAMGVVEGTWTSENKIGDISEGYAAIAPFGPGVSDETKAAVEAAKADLVSGKLTLFTGPIVDNAGVERIKPGEVADLGTLLGTTDYLVKGASGKIN